MTEILAGGTGGLLALAGAFTVALLGQRERRRTRARDVASTFLADAHSLLVKVAMRTIGAANRDDVMISIDALRDLRRSGVELSLLADASLRDEIREFLDRAHIFTFTHTRRAEDDPGWPEGRDTYSAELTALTDLIYRQFGARKQVRSTAR